MARTTREAWAKRVERWKDSGLSAREYAAELGISSRALKWWKWKLSSAAASTASVERARRTRVRRPKKSAKAAVRPLEFVEMAPPVIREHVIASPSATPIEIVLRSGVQVRVTVGFDAPTLARVLDVVERRP